MQRFIPTWLPMLALALSIGCEKPPAETEPSPTEPPLPTKPAPQADYAAYEFPPISDNWGAAEYIKVRDTLLEIERKQPDLLITLAGPKGDVLARVASLELLAKALAEAPDINTMLDISESIGAIFKLYAARIHRGQAFGPECLLLTAAMLHSFTAQFPRLLSEIGEAKLKTDAVRREGLLKMRHGLATIYLGALETPMQVPAIVEPRATVAQLGVITADVAPFLLPNERQYVDQYLTVLAGSGADPMQVATTRAAIAGAAMHPLIATYASEAQAFSDQQRQVVADVADLQQAPVEVGPEPGGVRYAFPDGGFSAVFHMRPNGMLTTSTATDGVEITTRMLGVRDATGYSTVVMCMSRPTPFQQENGRSFARNAIDDKVATDIREVEISGHKGFEARVSTSISSGIMRTVEIGPAGCMIIVESPPHLADSYEKQGRAFLDSVRID